MIAESSRRGSGKEVSGSSAKADWRFRWRGSFGVMLLAPAAVLALLSRPVIAAGTWLDLSMDFIAWAAFIAGLTFRLWATLYVGGRKTQTLMMDGPFSICRNPLYVGSLLVAGSCGLFLKSLTFAAALGLVMVCYIWATVPSEERELRRIHGEAYDAYCRLVPRFLPCLRLFHTPDCLEVKVKGLRIEFKRLIVWIWLPFLGELLAHLRVEQWWPNLLGLR